MKSAKRAVTVSHGNKMMFPESGINKFAIAAYYRRVSELMLPQLKNRPLMLQRFPNGIKKNGFFQKEVSAHFPDWIPTVTVPKEDGEVNHVVCNDEETLIYLVNQGTISFHSWLSNVNSIDHPDKFIIDLDPASNDFNMVRRGALVLKAFMDNLSVTSYVMATGSSGLHVVIPLDGRSTFDESRTAGSEIAEELTALHPDLFTMERYKKNRQGKLYFDIQRNAYAQTAIAAYSLRPIPGAPVATPLHWEELQDKALTATTWKINNIDARLNDIEDPWKGMRRHAISVKVLRKKIAKALVASEH